MGEEKNKIKMQVLPSGSLEVSNKHLMKDSKKVTKKQVVGLFCKKDWYNVKASPMFNIRNMGKTLLIKTLGTQIRLMASGVVVFEVSLADVQNNEVAFSNFKLITEDVQGKNCLISMAMITVTKHAPWSKMATVIEVHVDVKITSGYLLICFLLALLKKKKRKCNNQVQKNSYAQHQQVCQTQKMMEIMTQEMQTND